jgi:hypothetical protein
LFIVEVIQHRIHHILPIKNLWILRTILSGYLFSRVLSRVLPFSLYTSIESQIMLP